MASHTPEHPLEGLQLDTRQSVPLHQQIAECIKQRIASGSLCAGARLPSSRDLASQLGVSRATVELAYSNLAAEAYVGRRPAAGTHVLPVRVGKPPPAPRSLPLLMPGMASEPAQPPRLFQMGLPALDVFPRKLWSRLAARHARSLPLSRMVYQEPSGLAPLRRAIANHLSISRGLACSEGQVFVTAGFLGALALAARTLLAPGDKVWIEDPGFPPARQALELAGGELVPVPVDGCGIDVSAGMALAPLARLALVTPAVQFPLGSALSASRRSQLLSWAARTQAWVLLDDYEGHFSGNERTRSAPQPADATERVLHLGSFSNVLFPAVRLGWLVAPPSLAPELERVAALLPSQQSLIDQMVVCEFIEGGHLARHLARLRSVHAERRSALAQALNEHLGDLGRIEESRGMHLLFRLAVGTDDLVLAAAARSHGLAVNALSAMALRASTGPGLLLGFTNIGPQAARDAALRLRTALEASAPPPGHQGSAARDRIARGPTPAHRTSGARRA